MNGRANNQGSKYCLPQDGNVCKRDNEIRTSSGHVLPRRSKPIMNNNVSTGDGINTDRVLYATPQRDNPYSELRLSTESIPKSPNQNLKPLYCNYNEDFMKGYCEEVHAGSWTSNTWSSASSISTIASTNRKKSSARELRDIVISQCKLQEEIDKSIRDLKVNQKSRASCSTQTPLTTDDMILLHCKSKLQSSSPSTRSVASQTIANFSEEKPKQTISKDQLRMAVVVGPVIQKAHDMYLNNLRNEVTFLEELDKLPAAMTELYNESKSTFTD